MKMSSPTRYHEIYKRPSSGFSLKLLKRLRVSLLLFLIAFVVVGGAALHQIKTRLDTFAFEMNQVVLVLQRSHQPQALRQAQGHVQAARAAIAPFHRPMQGVAHLNKVVSMFVTQQLIDWWIFVDESTLAAQNLLNAAVVLTALETQPETWPVALLSKQAAVRNQLEAAHTHLLQADAVRPQLNLAWIPANYAPQAQRALAEWDARVPLWRDNLPQVIALVDQLPTALGHPQAATYLLMIQSTDNLRATGGFLSGIGRLTLENGRVTHLSIRDVVEAEFSAAWTPEQGFTSPRIVPPDPIRRYLGLGHWMLRDGNWWADFPTTARQVVQFWNLVDNTPVDGVIAITDQGIANLLEVVGPISISGGQTLTAQNMKTVAARRLYFEPVAVDENRQSIFFQEVASNLLPQLEQLSIERWLALLPTLQTMAQHHDILVFSVNPALARSLNAAGIDGSLKGGSGDYFYLVEDNLSDSKLNSFVPQTLRYDAYLDDDAWPKLSVLTIMKENNYSSQAQPLNFPTQSYFTGGRWDAQTRRWDRWEGYYGGYLRLFPPPKSRLVQMTGFDDNPADTLEGGRTVFGNYVGLWPGAERQLQIRWEPAGQPEKPGQYRLLVQRQPGALDYPLVVVIHLPPGYAAIDIAPAPQLATDYAVRWEVTLNQDRLFLLKLIPDAQ